MSFSEIEQIKGCQSVQELSELWSANVKEWSQLPRDQARELIRVKDEHKAKLELFEEWSFWYEERAAIAEYDGGLSRQDAETLARERLRGSS
jgi:hypothetical protein